MLFRHSKRRGYVLVLTLSVIALAAISLAGFARHSLQLVTTARSAAEELQSRWGRDSIRRVLLARAGEILDAQVLPEQMAMPPWPKPGRIETNFQLGMHNYAIVLADEDAKVNLRAIHGRRPQNYLPSVRRLLSLSGAPNLAIFVPTDRQFLPASWGQVFDLAQLSPHAKGVVQLIAATRDLTCWGSGRLNLRRASDTAVSEVAQLALPAKDASELVELRQHWGGHSVDELLAQLALRRPQLAAAKRLLGAEGRTYSLWITATSGSREEHYFYVTDNGLLSFAF